MTPSTIPVPKLDRLLVLYRSIEAIDRDIEIQQQRIREQENRRVILMQEVTDLRRRYTL